MLDPLVELHARLASPGDREEGQGLVEYGLIIVFVALVVFAALALLGPKVAGIFNSASASF